MRISLTDAKGQLAELVRRAEAGEAVELTRHGQVVAELKAATAAKREFTREDRARAIAQVRTMAGFQITPGPDAAHAADFLYDEDGMPA